MSSSINTRGTLFVHGVLFAVQMAFATLSVFGRIALRELSATSIACARLLGTTLVVAGVRVALHGWPKIPRKDVMRLVLVSPLGIVINQVLFLGGVARTSALNGTVLTTTVPIFVVIFAVLLGREKLNAFLAGGVLTACAGIVFCIGGSRLNLSASALLGDAMILGNAASYALYLIFVRDIIQRHGPWQVMPYVILFGLLTILPFGAPDLFVQLRTASRTTWLALAWLVLVPTIFTYLANGWALLHAPASLVAVYICMQPLGTAVLAAFMLNEPLTTELAYGGVLVCAGILLVQRAPKPVASERQSDAR